MSFGAAADHILQQAQSDYRARLSQPGDKLWARVGDSAGFVRVSPTSDHIYVHYLGSVPYFEAPIEGPLMLARNFTGHEYVAGDVVPVEWMDDGVASVLRITARASISYRRVALNAIAHVGGIDKKRPDSFDEATVSIEPSDSLKRTASAYALRIPPSPYQGVCGHPTQYHSYYTICIFRGQVIEVEYGRARPVAGGENSNELLAGEPPDQVGVLAFGSAEGGGGEFVTIRPRGVVADPDGNIYVLCLPPVDSDYTSDLIGTFQVDGTWSWVFGNNTADGYSGDGGVCEDATGTVTQMAIATDGSLYFTDNVNKVVRKIAGPITPTSVISRVAGYDPLTGPPDPLPVPPIGNPLEKELYTPIAIAADTQTATIYVADDPVIYAISGGAISVFAGTPTMLTGGPVEELSPTPHMPGLPGAKNNYRYTVASMTMGVDGGLYVIIGGQFDIRRFLVVIHSFANPIAELRNVVEWHAGYYDGADFPIPGRLLANMGPHMTQSRFPYPQAPINEANSLSFDLTGDLYFTDSYRNVVRKMMDDDYWVTASHGTTLMVFRPDASYMQEAPLESTAVIPVGVAELDTDKKVVGLRRVNDPFAGFNTDIYYAHVLVYSETDPQGRYVVAGGGLQGWGGLAIPAVGEAPPVYYTFQIFFAFLSGSLMAFVRSSATTMIVYRLVAGTPPPNPFNIYVWETYATLESGVEWRNVSSSGTYASVVYISYGEHTHIEVEGLPGIFETRLFTTDKQMLYDGDNLYEMDHWAAMGVRPRGNEEDYQTNVGAAAHHMVTVSASAEGEAHSFYERIRGDAEANSFFTSSGGASFPNWNVIAGMAWHPSGGVVLTVPGAVPPSGAIHTYGEGRIGETYSTITLFYAFGSTTTEQQTYFVLIHEPFGDAGVGGTHEGRAIGSQYFIFSVSGHPDYPMPAGLWVGTADGALIHLVPTSSAGNPAHLGKFTLANEATRFSSTIGG